MDISVDKPSSTLYFLYTQAITGESLEEELFERLNSDVQQVGGWVAGLGEEVREQYAKKIRYLRDKLGILLVGDSRGTLSLQLGKVRVKDRERKEQLGTLEVECEELVMVKDERGKQLGKKASRFG